MSDFLDTDQANKAAMMAQYGIVRVPVEQFHYKGWRYSSLRDAVAQAKRISAESSQEGAAAQRHRHASLDQERLL